MDLHFQFFNLFLDYGWTWIGLSFKNSGLDQDRKI